MTAAHYVDAREQRRHLCHRDRCRHDRRPQPSRVRRRPPGGRVVPRVHPALPTAGLGRARRRTRSGRPVAGTLDDVVDRVGREHVAAIGITNQRETVVAWDRTTGRPYGSAIVWQDRRTAARCDELAAAGSPTARARRAPGSCSIRTSGAPKFEWLLRERGVPSTTDLALGTIDAWLIWNLTGGEVHATDVTNASRTMLFDIAERCWSRGAVRPAPRADRRRCPRCGRRAGGSVSPPSGAARRPASPISGIAGDQQAALFGQACFEPGMAKNTYGTGSFVLLNVGPTCPPPTEGMLTTVAWTLADGTVAYALEGAIFVTGAAIQWLRDGLGIIDELGRGRPARRERARHRRRVRRAGVHRARVRRGGTRTPEARSSASPAARPAPTSPGPSSRRWRTRPAMRSMRWRGQRHGDHRAARRRWCVGDGRAAAAAGRPARRDRAAPRATRRPQRSARRTSPASPRACGPTSTRSGRPGSSTQRSNPRTTARSPISSTRSGSAPSNAAGVGRSSSRRRAAVVRAPHHRLDRTRSS